MSELVYRVRSLSDQAIEEQLAELERRFGMTSAEFLRRFNAGDLADRPEFIDWSGLLYVAHRAGLNSAAQT